METVLSIVVGLLVASLLAYVGNNAHYYLCRHPPGRRTKASGFAMLSLMTSAGSFFLALDKDWGHARAHGWFASFSTILLTTLFGLSALGQLHEWPGFRDATAPDFDSEDDVLYEVDLDA